MNVLRRPLSVGTFGTSRRPKMPGLQACRSIPAPVSMYKPRLPSPSHSEAELLSYMNKGSHGLRGGLHGRGTRVTVFPRRHPLSYGDCRITHTRLFSHYVLSLQPVAVWRLKQGLSAARAEMSRRDDRGVPFCALR